MRDQQDTPMNTYNCCKVRNEPWWYLRLTVIDWETALVLLDELELHKAVS